VSINFGPLVFTSYSYKGKCLPGGGEEGGSGEGNPIREAGEALTIGDAVYQGANNQVFKTDRSDTFKSWCIGFATETVSAGESLIIANAGEWELFTGLSNGDDYYLDDPLGGIVDTIPASGRRFRVGVASSSTSLVIQLQFLGII
jgi:hypothetical protein